MDAPPRESDPAVTLFLQELDGARKEVIAWRLSGGAEPAGLNGSRLAELREYAVAELGTLEKDVLAYGGSNSAEYAARKTRQIWRIMGRYGELVRRLDQVPFTVAPQKEQGLIVDVVVATRETPIPVDAGILKAEIDAAVNVVQSVIADRLRHLHPVFSSMTRNDALKLQDNYLNQLLCIAKVGLETAEPTRITFARADLVRMTNLFTLREAGIVKNAYVNRLAVWSALAAIVMGGLYFLARTQTVCTPIDAACTLFVQLRNFYILGAGTAVGTWLSFSLRRQELTFNDLAALEPDRLDPAVRVAFMIGIASLVGLLLFTGAVSLGIGSLSGTAGMHGHGSWALLIGLLAGVAERALGNTVLRRGLDFAGLASGTPVAAAKP